LSWQTGQKNWHEASTIQPTEVTKTMNSKNLRIWVWLQDDTLNKAVYNPANQTLIVYNEKDEIIQKRMGITPEQLTALEVLFLQLGAKRLDGHKEPYTYL
jgi:hypothetical protein